MGRSRSRRGRGKSGGQGSGGSGKGKGKGGSRGRSSNNRGGQGKGGSGSGKGTGGSRGRSNNTRGGQSTANRNQNKKARRTVKSIANSRVGKAIGKAFKGAAATASTLSGKPKKQSKLQQQLSNFKKRWQQMSTPEAKKKRRYDRLRNQFGLDYSRMRDGMTLKINPKQWLSGFEKKTKIPTGWLRNRIPQFASGNWINHTLRSPTRLGAKDGWHRGKYNSTGNSVKNSIRDAVAESVGTTEYKGPKDTLEAMYQNLLGRDIGQEGLDYWTDELESGRQNLDQVRANIIRGSEFQGRSDEDKLSVLKGIKEGRAQRGLQQGPQPVPGIDWQEYRRPRQLPDRYYSPGYPSRRGNSGGRFNQAVHHRDGGYRSGGPFGIAAALAPRLLRGSGIRSRSKPSIRNKNNKVAGSAAKSIAAFMAGMGGI